MLLMCSKHRLQISSAVAGWADFSFSHNEEMFSKCSVMELGGFYSKGLEKLNENGVSNVIGKSWERCSHTVVVIPPAL